MNFIYCLMGPTASGKTQLAVQLAQYFPFELISVDSAMVYRGMDIGTAKPSVEILKKAPHRLIDIRDPADSYSAAQFCQDALREIEAIFSQKKFPLLVGGTMLYFRALQKGLADMPAADAVIRNKILAEGQQLGWPELHKRLEKIDPEAGKRIHPHDSQRIQRALEVFEVSGKSISAWQNEGGLRQKTPNPPYINIAVAPEDRNILHQRIAERFDQMLELGFIDEVKKLFARGDLTLEMPAIRSVGYRQVWEYLLGNYSFEVMREKAIIATRQLAKRQLTWLRSWPEVNWFDSEATDLLVQVQHFLKMKNGSP